MLILAIDTALDACAAAVLDTAANKLIAQESQAMKRGHAEALMPLIARVMKASAVAFAALDRVGLSDVGTKHVGAFSRGMRQRLGLAEILMKDVSIAILDEPTSGLDPHATALHEVE